MDTIIKPFIFKNIDNLVAVQSTRLGGFSLPPYDSMNLGSNTADDKETSEKNKDQFCKQLGIVKSQVVRSKQIHGCEILEAEEGGYYSGYDAIITNKENLFLAVSTADCVSILLYDSEHKACAAIHAGWKGTHSMLSYLTLAKMTEVYGTNPANVSAYIGASIAECSFEVDADVAQYFDGPYVRFDSVKRKYFVDLKNHNNSQLVRLGVKEENIEVSPYDTFERTDLFYSHRKEKGMTGRMWSLIGNRPKDISDRIYLNKNKKN